jgi:Zn-dependent peptidase ImmA (M78 family)
MRRQAWLSEFRQDQGAEPNQFVASAAGSMSATGVASSIRRALGLTSVSDRPSNADDFLRDLVRRSEELGISVIRSGVVGSNTHRKLSVDEFRGFSLSDSFAPFIFVNGADVKPAQVFTLMHEMAHIWFGQTGISGDLRQADSALESLCNRVAAEVLVPAREFEQVWRTDLDDDEAIKMIARRFRVSRFVAAIRAYESGFIEEARLEELLESYRSSVRARTSEGGDYYRNAIVRNGRSFTTSVFNALARQTVLTGEASALLEVSPRRLGRLGEEIRGGG